MRSLFYQHTWVVLLLAVAAQLLAALAGDALRRATGPIEETARKDFSTIVPAAFTLLALIVGFSFSMAAGRYDQRKTLEEAEANAIGTEYVRADLMPAQAAEIKELLRQYTANRIQFYDVSDPATLQKNDATRAKLQDALWEAAGAPAATTPTPVTALVAAGMNDTLNSQSYTQAAYWNHLPDGAWFLMIGVAICCNLLFGYSDVRTGRLRLLLLPLIISFPFFLIADLDSPRGGLIHVVPQNLIALQQSMRR